MFVQLCLSALINKGFSPNGLRLTSSFLTQVQMKDFRFSYKFKMACKEDVLKLCPNIKKKWV